VNLYVFVRSDKLSFPHPYKALCSLHHSYLWIKEFNCQSTEKVHFKLDSHQLP